MSGPDKDSYDVGYRKPPKSGQFQKGKSGNPRGRPKGARGLKTDLKAELGERVTITENGRTRTLTKQQLVVKQLTAKAVKADIRAISKITELVISLLGPDDEVAADTSRLSEDDDAILQQFIERQGREPRDD
ncbi:hypothetical protein ROLI_033240 [Roseobacter fucihabitans]|uniref:DUF5681 domain-containing protein n=1 Tax=Roseobacter fucihabitans TaxID=1537242 RepID=A0ABZ2BVZ0_9RHOB|nr:DUF5681 domain-containing protein [Roseobacter litoralis]MBC6966742.1 hypothetical protein [Roseobacter litoralis]